MDLLCFLGDFFDLPEPRDLEDDRSREGPLQRVHSLDFDQDRRSLLFDRERFLDFRSSATLSFAFEDGLFVHFGTAQT